MLTTILWINIHNESCISLLLASSVASSNYGHYNANAAQPRSDTDYKETDGNILLGKNNLVYVIMIII